MPCGDQIDNERDMWSSFKALAARIGLSAEKIAAVEQEGGTSLVQHPLDEGVEFVVRPDPDWTQRLREAWQGNLVNSRRETAGTFQIIDGLLEISDVASPDKSITMPVVPGEYEVSLTIAHLGSEQTYDYEEHISHAVALLKGNRHVAAIEPLTDEDGVELCVNAYAVGFGTDGVIREACGDHAGRWALKLGNMFFPESPSAANRRDWITIKNDNGQGAVVAFHAGHGKDDYPVFRLSDANGQTIGVLADFFVDNRPW
ncbi:hypothetical protein MOK15_02125 [Sphingobium sp. BYY-5]|uniref:hypothetical protein n=1 Tax=Sphingobium sp. BYY-5 TaxID=2926400 RepID=UPI001FA6F710|nr:hypothetical protein [Sphingobium sp. BYY-5]MCI4588906.1 hypothetical protein [Sphingobium sp. BYY-5]